MAATLEASTRTDALVSGITTQVNRGAAALNREELRRADMFAVSLFGGPGCGKTLLLQETLKHLNGLLRCGVIIGNIRAERDAEILRPWCRQLAVVETLDLTAPLVREALDRIDLAVLDVLFIERGAGGLPQL